MEWEFPPQQVVKSEVGYGLDELRHNNRRPRFSGR